MMLLLELARMGLSVCVCVSVYLYMSYLSVCFSLALSLSTAPSFAHSFFGADVFSKSVILIFMLWLLVQGYKEGTNSSGDRAFSISKGRMGSSTMFIL